MTSNPDTNAAQLTDTDSLSPKSDKNRLAKRLGLAALLGTLAVMTGLALFSAGSNQARAAAPTVETASAPADAPADEKPPVVVDNDSDEESKPEDKKPEIDPTKPPATKPPAVKQCAPGQFPGASDLVVVNIPADDSDGGLVLRTGPSASATAFDVAPAGQVISFADYVENDGCVVATNGSVWWALVGFDTETVWANSAFLAEDLASHPEQEEEDAHGDCVVLPSDPQGCVLVFRNSSGITFVDPTTVPVELAQLDCVYNGVGEACEVLSHIGFGPDGNYGLGNSLTQAPSNFLQDDCNLGLPLACAELATRS